MGIFCFFYLQILTALRWEREKTAYDFRKRFTTKLNRIFSGLMAHTRRETNQSLHFLFFFFL